MKLTRGLQRHGVANSRRTPPLDTATPEWAFCPGLSSVLPGLIRQIVDRLMGESAESFVLKTMNATESKPLNAVGTVCAVLALLLGPFFAPLAIGVGSPDRCSMSCCVKAGHCCCIPPPGRAEGQADEDRGPTFRDSAVPTPCPPGCARTLPSTLLADVHDAFCKHLDGYDSSLLRSHRTPRAYNSLSLWSSSPRAPPFST